MTGHRLLWPEQLAKSRFRERRLVLINRNEGASNWQVPHEGATSTVFHLSDNQDYRPASGSALSLVIDGRGHAVQI